MTLDWQAISGMVGILALLGKAIHWIYRKFEGLHKENTKLRNENEELKILNARQREVLSSTSSFLKDEFIEGLDEFLDE